MGAGTSVPDRVLRKVCGWRPIRRRDGFWQQLAHLLHADRVFYGTSEACADYVLRHGTELCSELLVNNPQTSHFQVSFCFQQVDDCDCDCGGGGGGGGCIDFVW